MATACTSLARRRGKLAHVLHAHRGFSLRKEGIDYELLGFLCWRPERARKSPEASSYRRWDSTAQLKHYSMHWCVPRPRAARMEARVAAGCGVVS